MRKIATILLFTFACLSVTSQNHYGEYTQSGIGKNIVTGEWLADIGSLLMNVEFYDDYILINSQKYHYQRVDNGWRIYAAKLNDYTVLSYYVDSQYDMFCRMQMSFMGMSQITQYSVTKGHAVSSSSNYNPYATPVAPSNSGMNNGGGSGHSTHSSKLCHLCKGSGACATCGGDGLYQGIYGTGLLVCPNCSAPYHRCSWCGGTGRK